MATVIGGRSYNGGTIIMRSAASPSRAGGSIVQRSGDKPVFVNPTAAQTGFVAPSGTSASRYPLRQRSGYIVTRQEFQANSGR